MDKIDMKAVGARLKKARLVSGHTQESVAEILGTNARQIWRWESGEHLPNIVALLSLANLYDVTCDYLLGRFVDPDIGLSLIEMAVLMALRENDRLEAIRLIADPDAQPKLGDD